MTSQMKIDWKITQSSSHAILMVIPISNFLMIFTSSSSSLQVSPVTKANILHTLIKEQRDLLLAGRRNTSLDGSEGHDMTL